MSKKTDRFARERLERASRRHRATDAEVRKAALDQVDRHAALVETLRATLDRLEARR